MQTTPWFVEFPQFRSREEFFSVVSQIGKIPETQFNVKLPSSAEIRADDTDIVLVGGGMSIQVKSGCVPSEISSSRVSFGFGSIEGRDWWIGFDQFPHIQVKLYKHRGRPRKDTLRARIRGEDAEGKNLSRLSRKLGMSRAALGHYLPPRNGMGSAGVKGKPTRSVAGPSKTPGN